METRAVDEVEVQRFLPDPQIYRNAFRRARTGAVSRRPAATPWSTNLEQDQRRGSRSPRRGEAHAAGRRDRLVRANFATNHRHTRETRPAVIFANGAHLDPGRPADRWRGRSLRFLGPTRIPRPDAGYAESTGFTLKPVGFFS